MTEYVVTRWYRAPEIMLASGVYTEAVDTWALGCILAEMLAREPLFPGRNYIDQLGVIAKVIGKPSPDDLDFVFKPKARQFMLGLPDFPPCVWSERFPHAPGLAVDLVSRLLIFHPSKRITTDEALEHPYLAPVAANYPNMLTTASYIVDMADIHRAQLKVEPLRSLLVHEVSLVRKGDTAWEHDRNSVAFGGSTSPEATMLVSEAVDGEEAEDNTEGVAAALAPSMDDAKSDADEPSAQQILVRKRPFEQQPQQLVQEQMPPPNSLDTPSGSADAHNYSPHELTEDGFMEAAMKEEATAEVFVEDDVEEVFGDGSDANVEDMLASITRGVSISTAGEVEMTS